MKPFICYIGVGSNMGNRALQCEEAVSRLGRLPTTTIIRRSSLYETEPVCETPQNWFINCVVEIETLLEPREFLDACLEIEKMMGRQRDTPQGPRTIDLDILFYDDLVLSEEGLTIPHPRLHERRFVLEPLAEIAPHLKHPVLNKTVSELLSTLADPHTVRKWNAEPKEALP